MQLARNPWIVHDPGMNDEYKVWYANDNCGPAGSSETLWVLPPGEETPWLWCHGWDAVGEGRDWNVRRRPTEAELAVWRAKDPTTRRLKPGYVQTFLSAREADGPCLGYPIKQD